jgi:hypothetical protein
VAQYFFLYSGNEVKTFGCGSGWNRIILDALDKINAHIESLDDDTREDYNNGFRILQIKEKFGTLRIYTTFTSDTIEAIIEEAEQLSSVTCEACGAPGLLRCINNWYITACDKCAKEYEEVRNAK